MLEQIFPNGLLTNEVTTVLGVILSLLTFFTLLFFIWEKINPQAKLEELKKRTNSWWIIFTIFTITMFINKAIAVCGLAYLSFIALRELTSSLDLRLSDRRMLLWCYIAIPIQFYLAYQNNYGLFIIFIPVIIFLILPFRAVITGDTVNVTRSFSIIQWSLMLTVFSISHIAYLLNKSPLPGFSAGNGGLLLYLIFLTQFNDVLQFIWGKTLGKRKILPKVSPNKTWEGFLGGVFSTTILGYLLKFLTPLNTQQALIMGFMIAVTGFCGDVVVSSIKRDYGIKDMGNTIPGHGGIMDRIDSLTYTSLVFMHLIHFFCWE